MNIIILIPIYKESLSLNEEKSLFQCIRFLSEYHICIVTSDNLNIKNYEDFFISNKCEFMIERFDEKYFKSVLSYNDLMLRRHFYSRFFTYTHILIYQLDAFVFRNELDYWCIQGFDYIGAPWFEENECHEKGYKLNGGVGNGGFSLRNITFIKRLYSWKFPILTPKTLFKRYYKANSFLPFVLRIPLIISKCFGFQNNVRYFTQNKKYVEHEDTFWSIYMKDSWLEAKIPNEMEALKFSFEKSPRYLYELNNKNLPFGCHAWEKYDPDFWSQFI